jgi:hypothetical protein
MSPTTTERVEVLERDLRDVRQELDEHRACLDLLARAAGFDPDALRFPEAT